MAMMLRIDKVKERTGKRSSATLYGEIKLGLFTKPIPIGVRSVAWLDTEVDAINRARAAGKSNDDIRTLVISLHEQRVTAGEAMKAGV